MAFLQFIFFIFLVGIFFIAVFIYNVYINIHRTIKNVKDQMGGSGSYGQSSRQSSYSRRGSEENTSRANHRADGDVIYDQRSRKEANQKIFSKDEGEYVDFEEEK